MFKKVRIKLNKNHIFIYKNYDFLTTEIDTNLKRLIIEISVVTHYVS
jgi:hypothetical protein